MSKKMPDKIHNYLLALETSGKTSSFALLDNDDLVGEVIIRFPVHRKDSIAFWIHNWLRDLDVPFEKLNNAAVSWGPGSFTGLRVGMSIAKGLCLSHNIPLWQIPTLQAMALAAPPSGNLLCPTTLARRGECYAALYRWVSDNIEELDPPFVADAQQLCDNLPGAAWIWGEGAMAMKDDLEGLLSPDQRIVTGDIFVQRASLVARAARQKFLAGAEPATPDLEPFYLKQFPG